jgi:hypothetical protein
VGNDQAGATIIHERALLLEALTLLVQRQAETESALIQQVGETNSRVAAMERRSRDLEERLAEIGERLQRLASEVEPDPGLPRRVAVLQAQVERLHGRPVDDALAPTPVAQPAHRVEEPRVRVEEPRVRVEEPRARFDEPPARFDEPSPRFEAPPPRREVHQVRSQAVPPRRALLATSTGTLWERLGATNQDRASLVLMGTGVVVVLAAALAQLRPG